MIQMYKDHWPNNHKKAVQNYFYPDAIGFLILLIRKFSPIVWANYRMLLDSQPAEYLKTNEA